jgi:hypothetical protein
MRGWFFRLVLRLTIWKDADPDIPYSVRQPSELHFSVLNLNHRKPLDLQFSSTD